MAVTKAHEPMYLDPPAAVTSSVRLIDADPDIASALTPPERQAASRLALPVHSVPSNGLDITALLEETNAFGALVLDGILVHRVRVAAHSAVRLLGPGDVFCAGGEPSPVLLPESRCKPLTAARLALLGNHFLMAAHHCPRVVRGLLARIGEQSEREATHLAISQLPRVDDRLMSIMWLLAEKWGYVTPAGTVMPLALTHETLGGLIGARRPTVTVALRELSERGQLVKYRGGWLIPDPPPA